MAIITVRLPDKLKKQMQKLRHVNWSQIVRKSIEERVVLEVAQQGKDRIRMREASDKIDELFEGVKQRYGTINYDSSETVRLWREARYSSSSQTPQPS